MSAPPKPESRRIHTNNPEKEVWNVIRGFASEHFVTSFAYDRISKNFYNHPISTIISKKNTYNSAIPDSRSHAEILQSIQSTDIVNIVPEIANNAAQAIDFYTGSKELPLLSRPVLLHYAFEKLMNILVLLTFKVTPNKYTHGLTYYPNEPINVKLRGSFQRFHDCYSASPEIYLGKHGFALNDILNIGQLYDEELIDAIARGSALYSVKDLSSRVEVQLTELDREFLFIFAISTLARYRVNEWSEIVAGKTKSDIVRIERYLQSLQIVFPTLILNQLYNAIFLFYPYSRLG